MNVAAIILPNDEQLLSIALATAARRGLVLQTDGNHCVMAPTLLPKFGRITGGGDIAIERRRAGFRAHATAPDPEAA